MFVDQKKPALTARTKTERVNALKLGSAMHLSKEGFWPFFEVILDGTQHLRADIYAISNRFEAVIVEVKSSKEDYRAYLVTLHCSSRWHEHPVFSIGTLSWSKNAWQGLKEIYPMCKVVAWAELPELPAQYQG